MFSLFKKAFITLVIIIAIGIIGSLGFFILKKETLVELFKKEIIEKSNVSIDFSKISFSVFHNFPNISIVLNDATLFYPDKNTRDTLLFSKKLSFGINIINAFRGYYDFSLVKISDGLINYNYQKIDKLLEQQTSNTENFFLVSLKKITINNCSFKYTYGKQFLVKSHIKNATMAGVFNKKAFQINLNVNAKGLLVGFGKSKYNNPNPILIISDVWGNQKGIYTNLGNVKINDLPSSCKLIYTYENESLVVDFSSLNINLKKLIEALIGKRINEITGGLVSFNGKYTCNLNHIDLQKITISYQLAKTIIDINDDKLHLKYLKGSTVFTGVFEKNITDIKEFLITYKGSEFIGFGKIKNLPTPSILLDIKLKSPNISTLSKESFLTGKVEGNIKTLIHVIDINKLDYNGLKFIKLYSNLSFSEVSLKNYNSFENLSGTILLNNDKIEVFSKGLLFKSNFQASLMANNILDVYYKRRPISPTINISIDSLNSENFTSINKSNDNSINSFNMIGHINKLYYRDNRFENFLFKLKSNNNSIVVDTFSTNAFSGKISGTIPVYDSSHAKMSIYFKDIDVSSILKSFNNFGQTTITHNNIAGNLTGLVNASYKSNDSKKIDLNSVNITSNILIENGAFKGTQQFKQVSNFIKIDELESIKFKNLQNTITIKDGKLFVPSMNISSNALNVQLSGEHSFSGEYTYWIKVNLKEILARRFGSINEKETEYEIDKAGGLNLFLKIIGDSNSYKISYDRKSTLKHIKGNLNNEGAVLKDLFKDEFGGNKKDTSFNALKIYLNKPDSLNNKAKKNAFKIEWEEIDSTKLN